VVYGVCVRCVCASMIGARQDDLFKDVKIVRGDGLSF